MVFAWFSPLKNKKLPGAGAFGCLVELQKSAR
jgi:hypothetical protein